MCKRQYNRAEINKTNLDLMLHKLLGMCADNDFKYNAINDVVYNLHYMNRVIMRNKAGIYYTTFNNMHSKNNGLNATYPDLRERYVHEDYSDPCSYKREIRKALLYGTNTAELDITATAVYIYSKYISEDADMLNCYMGQDFYSIIPGKTRDEQKRLTQVWLQGPYNEEIIYNKLFPITGAYLKRTALKRDGLYKRNSGLFRNKEVELLDNIMSNIQVNFHLHDGIYIKRSAIKKAEKAIIQAYGAGVKYKVHNYSKDTDIDILSTLENVDWHTDDIVTTDNILDYPIMTGRIYPNGVVTHKYVTTDIDDSAIRPELEKMLYCKSLYNYFTSYNTIDVPPCVIAADHRYETCLKQL